MNKNKFSPYVRVAMLSTLTAPYKISRRIIFDYEIIFVTEGKCKITIEDKEYLCKKNDVVFLRPNVHHKFECVDNSNFVQPHIHFDILYDDKSEKRFVSFKAKNEMTENELNLISEDTLDIFIPYVFTPLNKDKFQNIFFELIELFQKKTYNYELLCKAKLLELLNCILVQFDSKSEIKADKISDEIIAVKNYIDSNYLSVITLEGLSKQFFINKYTLLRKFKSLYNQNVIAYYRQKRVEYIKNALKTTTLSISALSEKMNFSDIYSFSRFFKTAVGCSPTVYRKNFRIKLDKFMSDKA